MKTEKQTREDIIDDVTFRLEGTPDHDGLRGTLRRVRGNVERELESPESLKTRVYGRLKRALSKNAKIAYETESARIEGTIESDRDVKQLTGYVSFLENIRDATSSGNPLKEVFERIDAYETEGNQHRTSSLKAIFPEVLEQRLRSEYLDMPIQDVQIRPSHDQGSLNSLGIACRKHPQIAQGKLTEEVFERLKDLYVHVCRTSAENGTKPIVALYPSCGAYETADVAVSGALRNLSRARGMSEEESGRLIAKLEGNVDLADIGEGTIGMQVSN